MEWFLQSKGVYGDISHLLSDLTKFFLFEYIKNADTYTYHKKFKLEIARKRQVTADKRLTNLYEMNYLNFFNYHSASMLLKVWENVYYYYVQ